MQPNRIAVYLTALAALLAALAPVVADLDWTSTAGVIAGLLAIAKIVDTWLKGWQQYEALSSDVLSDPDLAEVTADDEQRDLHENGVS